MADSLAVFRKHLGPELSALAEQHLKHDLTPSDRDALNSAASTVTLHASIGSCIGLALGVLIARRIRLNRAALVRTLSTHAQPVALRFADGTEKAIPNLAPLIKASPIRDALAFTFLGLGGVFIGGETGLLTGTVRARQVLGQDRDRRERVQRAFRGFKADVLREQAKALDEGRGDGWGSRR